MSNLHSLVSPSSETLFARDFHSLSVRDLLDARDQFHVHLAHKQNVFSTAIGRYLIREKDKDKEAGQAHVERSPKSEARTLAKSSVKDWSWPCVLVFVNHWQTLDELRSSPTR